MFKSLFNAFTMFRKYGDVLEHPVVKVLMEVVPVVIDMVTIDKSIRRDKMVIIINRVYRLAPESVKPLATEEEIQSFADSLYTTVEKGIALTN